ncbi:MAG: CPBP family intramembrane glutamate endopeptidase [Cyanobium sp.]
MPVPPSPSTAPGAWPRPGLLLAAVTLIAPPAAQVMASAAAGTPTHPLPESSEELAGRSPWSLPQSYPLQRRPSPDLYRPSADWIGRLVLPTPAETAAPQAPKDDWVWIVLEQAPANHQALIGQRLRLRWQDRPHLRRLVATVTTPISLGEAARKARQEGNAIPTRLDGRRVGPLQSLAGSRPRDDLTAALEEVTLRGEELRIGSPPVQISGRWQALVTVLGPAPGDDRLRVRHFNRASGRFDGREETLRIPSLPPDRFGRRLIDPSGLVRSPQNGSGWLIQGAPASDGVFTVQALLPHALLQLTPQRTVTGSGAAEAFVRHDAWSAPLSERGSLHSTALLPTAKAPPRWAPGDRALLMHLFGGIGGADGEPVSLRTVTGHFAFGEAQVVRDAFTGQPRLNLRYHQIYATNTNGIVAGSQDWSAYAGNLQRGWIGLRPFSDVLVPVGPQVLDAIALQAEILAARYRSGDGSGVAAVTPSTSCVQDSAQALWIAIRQLRLEGERTPMAPFDRERLHAMGIAFDQLLKPFGRVRSDWSHNARKALAAGLGAGAGDVAGTSAGAGAGGGGGPVFETNQSLKEALLSWRSLLPRTAHDEFATEFLRAGLPMVVLRTNQIPGANPRLEPVAPTALLGQLPWLSAILGWLGDRLFPPPAPAGAGATGASSTSGPGG